MVSFGIQPHVAGGKATYVGRDGSVTRTTPTPTPPVTAQSGFGIFPGAPSTTTHYPGASGYGRTRSRVGVGPWQDVEEEDDGRARAATPFLPSPTYGTTVAGSAPRPEYRTPRVGASAPAQGPTAPAAPTLFQQSLDHTRNRKATSASIFAAAKAGGRNDMDARREAYAATHAPAQMPAAPSIGMSTGTPAQPAPAADPYANVDPKAFESLHKGLMAQAQQEIRAAQYDPVAKTTAQQKYNDARDKLNDFRARRAGVSLPAAPTTQPSVTPPFVAAPTTQPANPMAMPGAPTTQPAASSESDAPEQATTAYPNPPGNQTQLTAQNARAMWETLVKTQGQGADLDNIIGGVRSPEQQTLVDKFVEKIGEYGGSEQLANQLLARWFDKGTLNQSADDLVPGPVVTHTMPQAPISLLGPDKSGPQYSIGDGQAAAVAKRNRDSNRAPITTTEQTFVARGPQKGYTPLPRNGGGGGSGDDSRMAHSRGSGGARPTTQPAEGVATAAPAGQPMRLKNGRTVFAQADGSFLDEQGRVIIRR